MNHNAIENNSIGEEEHDLIECEDENIDPSPEFPFTIGHACVSIAPDVPNKLSASLEDSLLCSNNHDNVSDSFCKHAFGSS